MRKTKLLLAACAMLFSVGVHAQEDVTSTYLSNANFSEGTPIDNNVCTYGKDMEGNGTTYYGTQSIKDWTDESIGATDNDYDNCKIAGALFAYGSTPWLAGEGNLAPETDPEGNTGNAAGLCAVWGGTVRYTQNVTLQAGSYTIRFKTFNATNNYGSGKFITTNLFGFEAKGGATYYAPSKTFAIGQWSTIAVTFNLTEETTGKISMGYVGPKGGADMPHLFVDNVKILKNTGFVDVTNKVGVQANTDWVNASDGMQGSGVKTDDGRDTKMAARYNFSSVGTAISQTVTGLKKGTYEAVLYAYSQMEWKDAAWLNHDAGDVGYVLANGKYEVKEWINARRGPGYPADGPGIYSLSGIEVGDDGELTLGYALAKADQTEWHAVQIKSLIYTKNLDLSGFVEAYNNALALAKEVAAKTDKMASAIKTALNNAIDTYGDGKVDLNEADDLETAADALKEAADNANASIVNYAEAKAILDAASSFSADGQENYAADETISAIQSAYNDGTLEAVTAAQKTAADKALITACKAQAQPADGCYMTPWIVNPSFEDGLNGWTNSGMQTQGNDSFEKTGKNYCEAWTPNGTKSVSQIISELPAGVYSLSAKSKARGVTYAKLYAGKTEKAITIADETNTYTLEFVCTGGTTIGFEGEGTGAGNSWICVDDFQLTYVRQLTDEDVKEDAITGYNDALTAAQAITEGTIPSKAYSDLQSVITSNTLSDGTAAEYNNAAKALNDAATTASALVAPYATWKAMKDAAETLKAVANDNATANTTLGTAIETQNGIVEATTEIATINEATSELKSAMATYCNSANPVGDGAQFDMTFMLTNPNLEGLPTWTGAEGWYTEQEGGNSQVMTNNNATSTDGTKTAFYEYWANPAKANNLFALYLNIKLPAGTYNMSCYAFAQDDGTHENRPNGVYFYANDIKGSAVNNARLSEANIEFVNESEQEVKIGLKTVTGNTNYWMGIGYVQLFKVPAQAIELDETVAYTPESKAGKVTLKKTIYNGWNTIALPFGVDAETVTAQLGAAGQLYEYVDGDNGKLSFKTATAIEPHKPYLFNSADGDGSQKTMTFEGATISTGTPIAAGADYNFVGTYSPLAAGVITANDYVLAATDFQKASGNNTLKAFRAYIQQNEDAPEARQFLTIVIDGEATAIQAIDGMNMNNAAIYNLAGQQVKSAKKGLYIQNGKNVVVK